MGFFLLRQANVRFTAIAIVLGATLFATVQFSEDRLSHTAARMPLQLSEIEEALGYGGLIHNFKNYVLRPKEQHLAEAARDNVARALMLIDNVLANLEDGGVDASLTKTREAVHAYYERIDQVEDLHRKGATAREIDEIVRYYDAPALRELAVFRVQLATDVMARLEFLRWSGMAVFIGTLAGIIAVQAIALKENRNSRDAYALASGALERELEVNGELREFAYAMSHDMKSPMNTVHLLLEEIRAGQDGHRLSNDQRELIEKSLSTIDRVNVQIAELLRYAAMIETSEEQEESVDLDGEVRSVLEDLAADIEAADATLEVAPLPVILGNRAQLRVLFQNLVGNALKYRSENVAPLIRISAEIEARSGICCIHVADNGMGIAAGHQERIFGMFKRLHRQSQIPGTGLGLSVSRRVARNLGGALDVRSVPGQGSTFTLSIPPDRVITDQRRAA
ncbi:MAG: hypothetical protein LJE62_16480 [Silicimonas sp.]|nr:hypothetical protein [Silicimonas sp.]